MLGRPLLRSATIGATCTWLKMTGHHLGDPRGLRHRQQSGNGALLTVSGSRSRSVPRAGIGPVAVPQTGYFLQVQANGDRAYECGRGET